MILSTCGRDFSLPPRCLYRKNQFCIYNFRCTVTDIVHLLYPQHLVGCFEFFGYIFFFGEFFYQPRKHNRIHGVISKMVRNWYADKAKMSENPVISRLSDIASYHEVKALILKRALSRILQFFPFSSFFLNSARTFFFLALSFFLSFFQSQGRVLWQYEN